MAMSRVWTAWTMTTACAWQRPGQCQQHQQRTLHPRGAAAATNYRAVGAVDIVQAVATAHAVDIVHAVHTLDIAIAILSHSHSQSHEHWIGDVIGMGFGMGLGWD